MSNETQAVVAVSPVTPARMYTRGSSALPEETDA